jgi:hypothetical protein
MSYYGSFVLQCYVLRMRVMTSAVGGNLTNRPPPNPKTYTCQYCRAGQATVDNMAHAHCMLDT